MPTDVSEPNWRCDKCQHTFGQDRDAAERCEHAPVQDPLPEGAMILHHAGRFYIQRITQVRGPTRAHQGVHGWDYQIGDSYDSRKASQAIWPHDPDRLNIVGRSLGGYRPSFSHSNRSRGDEPFNMLLDRIGMSSDSPLAQSWDNLARWTEVAGPISDQLRALIRLFDVQFKRPAEMNAHRGHSPWKYGFDLLLMECGYNSPKANVQALVQDPQLVLQRLEDRWERWWAGEPISVPPPPLVAGHDIQPSKATKHIRQELERLGVQWPARTSSTQLVLEVMMKQAEKMDQEPELFPIPTVAVVGGKGGTGKTTVASALAVAMAGAGIRTLLVDLDMENPNQAALWNLGAPPVDREKGTVVPQQVVDRLAVLSVGSLLQPGESPIWDSDTWGHWIEFIAGAVQWETFDQLILDMGPGLTPAHRRLLQHPGHVDAWVHVSTGTKLSQDGCSRLMNQISQRSFNRRPATHVLVYNPVAGGPMPERHPLPGDEQPQVFPHDLSAQSSPIRLGTTDEMIQLADTVREAQKEVYTRRQPQPAGT